MRVLVTGGSGFVGCNVARTLKATHRQVRVFDLEPPSDPFCDFQQGSIESVAALDKAVDGCDTIVHAAAFLGVENCFRNPQRLLDVNIKGTLNLIHAAANHEIKNILFLSSSEVYGDGLGRPFAEEDPPAPKSLYGYTKLFGETAFKAFALEHNVQVTVVRLFNVYGPDQRQDFVVRTFFRQALSNQPITVFGDGTQVRTFTYIDDATAGIAAALQRTSGGTFEIFNLGSTQTMSAGELAATIKELARSDSPIAFVPFTSPTTARNAEQEIFYRVPSVAKMRDLLGFEARVDLSEGLSRVMSVMREQLAVPEVRSASR